jgi:hypothetical protein
MGMINSALKSSSPAALSLLHWVTAFLFLQHGTAKLFHVPHLAIFDQLEVLFRNGFAGTLEVVASCCCFLACLHARSFFSQRPAQDLGA